ncbi:MAG: transglycosylase domain-containing protein [Candidatus Paceibacterota bacterium]
MKLGEKTKSLIKIGAIGAAIIGGALLVWASTFQIPDLSAFNDRTIVQSTKIYDRTGEHLLYEFHGDIKRTVVPFEEMSRHIKNATIAIEDEDFYKHFGIKPSAIIRAAFSNLKEGDLLGGQGGSTITQQVVKNSLLTNEKTITRKMKEWVLALKMEKVLTKEDILEMYLNEVPYGGNMYGIEEAARRFYGKTAMDLTLAESAYLAALPQAPTYFSPYGNNRDALEERKNTVLRRMRAHNFITKQEYKEAMETTVDFAEPGAYGIFAPHFVFYVGEYIEKNYGPRALNEYGLNVITTLDYDLQRQGQEIVKRQALSNTTNFNARNAALVAIDPKTGQILTMVGSRDYFDEQIPGKFNTALAHRQPGSAFKPFVYATAFKRGYTPETIVYDLKTQFSVNCSASNLTSENNCYSPVNYDGNFQGPITFRNALAQSVNIPAVKALYLAGMQESLRTARDMGINSLEDVERYGLTLVLGGGEVSLLDMTSSYSVFGNDGIRNPYQSILRIEDTNGDVLEEFNTNPRRAISSEIARQINDILSDNDARAPAFGQNSYLHFPGQDVAAKTGTTNDYRDAWIVGYSPTISVGAWAGNNDNSPMVKRVAGFIIAPLWNEFMQIALEKYPTENFKDPRPIDGDIKPILQGDAAAMGGHHSILHWVNKENPRGSIPSNPSSDPQYRNWEYSVSRWATNRGFNSEPQESSFQISGLNSEYSLNEVVSFTLSPSNLIERYEVKIDGELINTSEDPTFSFTPNEIDIDSGRYTLNIEITTTGGDLVTLQRQIDILN